MLVEAVIPATGSPEQFVSVPLAGVPRTGATNVVPLGNVGVPDKFAAVPEILESVKAIVFLVEAAVE